MISDDVVERFWANVHVTQDVGSCWLWTGDTFKLRRAENYGRFSYKGTYVGAHRMSYALSHEGENIDGLNVCHSCDKPLCVRPSHLFLGTQAENLEDMRAKGRDANIRGARHWARRRPETVPRGEASFSTQNPERMLRGEDLPQTRMTAEKVLELRALYATGQFTQEELAARFGISRTAVSAILLRRNWKHI